jgi:hypothetical protein
VPFRTIAVLLLLAAVPAFAADPDLPPLTSKDKPLVMAFDEARTTSQCVGKPATPMCAIETMFACWNRGDHHLCRIGLNLDHEPNYGGGAPHPDDVYLYRVVKRQILTKKTLPWKPEDVLERPGLKAPEAGDMRVDIWMVRCNKEISPAACENDKYASTSAFIVRREGDRWTVLQWFDL